jgi:hypothetical protein
LIQHYIYLADDALAHPILLSEAINDLAHIMLMSPNVGKISPPGDEEFAAWMWARAGLSAGAAEAFVQARLSRRWARLPRAFWGGCDVWEGPPATLEESEDPELRGQPIIVRSDGLSTVHQMVWDALTLLERGAEQAPSITVAEVAKATASRGNPVSERALEDWFKTVRVPSIGDGKAPTWESCHDAAKEAFAGRWVTRDRLQAVRKRSVPESWNKPGPRGPRE